MARKLSCGIQQCVAIGVLIASVILLGSCANEKVQWANRVPFSPDPLLGKWVMIGANGSGSAGAIADYRADGTVVFTHKGRKITTKHRRMPGKVWADRRAAMSGRAGTNEWLDHLKKPGMEMILFAGPDGKFLDHGGSLLTLDPERCLLYNPITQLWCRPGEEERVRAEIQGK